MSADPIEAALAPFLVEIDAIEADLAGLQTLASDDEKEQRFAAIQARHAELLSRTRPALRAAREKLQ